MVVEQMTDPIITTDMDNVITAVNPAGEKVYGLSEEEAVGRRLDEVIDQLRVDGTALGSEATDQAGSMGYWHGRVIHRPLIGRLSGRHIVVDLSLTSFRDERHKAAGLIAMAREVPLSGKLESEGAALSSLAVATGRARSRREVAEAALERLSEATMADAGVIVTWGAKGPTVVEASRGFSQDSIDVIRESDIADLDATVGAPGTVVGLESVGSILTGSGVAAVLAREGLVTGFLVDLRSRDESRGLPGSGGAPCRLAEAER